MMIMIMRMLIIMMIMIIIIIKIIMIIVLIILSNECPELLSLGQGNIEIRFQNRCISSMNDDILYLYYK